MKTPRKAKQWSKELIHVVYNVLQALDDEAEAAEVADDTQEKHAFTKVQVKRMMFEISYEISQRRGIDIVRVSDIIPGILLHALKNAESLPAEARTSEMLIIFLYLHTHIELGLMNPKTLQKILEHMQTLVSKSAL